jgi:hypothetical protein
MDLIRISTGGTQIKEAHGACGQEVGKRANLDLHLTSNRNSIKLTCAISKCQTILLLATPKLAAGFLRNISG